MTINRLPRRKIQHVHAQGVPDAIQSWGLFFAVDPGRWTITHVSENTDLHIQVDAAGLLGQPLSNIFDVAALDSVREVVSGDRANPTKWSLTVTRSMLLVTTAAPVFSSSWNRTSIAMTGRCS